MGGLVGAIGGLGGFIMSFLFVLSVTCLVWMHVVIVRMSREAAPLIAQELVVGSVAHPSPPPAA